jgi:hypothetical protein
VEFQENGDIQLFCNEKLCWYGAQGEVYARLDATRSPFKFHSNILLANKVRLKT